MKWGKTFFVFLVSIITVILLVLKHREYRKKIEPCLNTPIDTAKEAKASYEAKVEKIVSTVAQAEAEEIVALWQKRFGKH